MPCVITFKRDEKTLKITFTRDEQTDELDYQVEGDGNFWTVQFYSEPTIAFDISWPGAYEDTTTGIYSDEGVPDTWHVMYEDEVLGTYSEADLAEQNNVQHDLEPDSDDDSSTDSDSDDE